MTQEIYNIENYQHLREKDEKLGKLKYVYDEPVIIVFSEERIREALEERIEKAIEGGVVRENSDKTNILELTAKLLDSYQKFRASGNYTNDVFGTMSLSDYRKMIELQKQNDQKSEQSDQDKENEENEYLLAVGSIDIPIENPLKLTHLCYGIRKAKRALIRPLKRSLRRIRNIAKNNEGKENRDVARKVNPATKLNLDIYTEMNSRED